MTILNSSFKNGAAGAAGAAGAQSDVQKAFDAGCRKLSARMRTEKEIRGFLKQNGFREEAAEEAVAMLKEYRYLDDERYCKEYFRYAKAKGRADGRIVKELAAKGVSPELARNAIEDARCEAEAERSMAGASDFFGQPQTDDRTLAMEIGEKMARQQCENGKDRDEKFFARVGRRLAGLGYDSGTIYSVLGKLRQDERDRQRDY